MAIYVLTLACVQAHLGLLPHHISNQTSFSHLDEFVLSHLPDCTSYLLSLQDFLVHFIWITGKLLFTVQVATVEGFPPDVCTAQAYFCRCQLRCHLFSKPSLTDTSPTLMLHPLANWVSSYLPSHLPGL